MKVIIGIDGGGTKTHCIAANFENKILYETKGKASNFLILGAEKVSQTIFSLIEECVDHLKINFSDVEIVLLGTTGAGRKSDADRLKNSFDNLLKDKKVNINFVVESDARIALEAAFSGKPGSILIAGTGSIMFGKDLNGNIHRVGGFGRFIGDQGSGFSIGKKGLIAVSKNMDGRARKTIITELLNKKFNISNSEELIIEVYKNNFDIASAAPVVIDAAEQNDKTALNILDEESDELISHIITMKKKLNQTEMNLSLIGSLISTNNFFTKIFNKKIKEISGVKLIKPENTPAMGAILMARELINIK